MEHLARQVIGVNDALSAHAERAGAALSPLVAWSGLRGTYKRTYTEIVAVALAFWAIELLSSMLVRRKLMRLLNPNINKPGLTQAQKAKMWRHAKGAAIQAIARLVGSLHNSIQVPLALLIILDPRFNASFLTRDHATSPLSYAVCLISAGYFFHDLVMCAYRFHLEGPLYLIHAAACHAAFIFGYHTGLIHFHGAAFLMWEISTPFVHTRWFMYKAGWANNVLYLYNGIAMIVAFFGCRIAWGYTESIIMVQDIWKEQGVPKPNFPRGATIGYTIAAVIMNSLNTYWFSKMITAALHLARGKKGSEIGSHKDE